MYKNIRVEEESDIPAKSDSAILGQFSPTFPDTASFLLGSGELQLGLVASGHRWAEDRDGQRTQGEAAEDKDGRSSGHRQCQSDRLSIQSEDNRRSNKRESDKSKQ